MPGLDGTGPAGRGPMTGWRRGRCIVSGASATENVTSSTGEQAAPASSPVVYGLGRGGIPCGCGRGFGGGRRRRF